MTIDVDVLHSLVEGTPEEAWQVIIQKAVEIASKPLSAGNAQSEVTKRDREIGTLDYFLSSSGWDLWQVFGDTVERTTDRLVQWWGQPYSSKAVLILDGLSLRELPWLLQGAKKHGFTLHEVTASASEIPGETNEFAGALGFGSRSHLQNNGAGATHKLQSTNTESVDIAWKDCQHLIDFAPNWVFWHHWPDSKLHDGSGAGQGLEMLTRDVAQQLSSDDFWEFVERLAQGRRLVITSDHGYAATGYFSDADGEVGQFLKKNFASGRSKPGTSEIGPFVPPVAMQIKTPYGAHLLAVGRWKWKSQGGYPTLTHGGLSLLEVLSPFIELSK
ncbi:hypothetical protein [Acidicapsa acidisoli]|uniref:hypothetical protein n=1 Tax=Acidicapsa acidisoli TaxID=1615681 RepID=UPI0021E0765E|nr:hypothetical protein [Acidicapsa acidisoli]